MLCLFRAFLYSFCISAIILLNSSDNKPPNVVDLTDVYKIFLTLNNNRKNKLNVKYYFKRTCLSKSTNLQGSLSAIMLQPYTIIWAGIATRYGLDDPGIESQWGSEIFCVRLDCPWFLSSLLYIAYRFFPVSKGA